MAKRWYVLHVFSGSEKKVAQLITEQAESNGLEHQIDEVMVPTEEVVEMRRGVRVQSEKKFFPGYILVKMELTDEAWQLVTSQPRVTGFLGGKGRPVPITNAFVYLTPTSGGRLAAEPQNELDNRRQHHIDKQEKDRGNGGHHEYGDGGGPGFTTSSPGNTRYFLTDLPYKLRWRRLCHDCLVPIQVSVLPATPLKAQNRPRRAVSSPRIAEVRFSGTFVSLPWVGI